MINKPFLDTSPNRLREELIKSIEKGKLTNTFALMADDICWAMLFKRKYDDESDIAELTLYSFKIRLCKKWETIDPESNINSYLCGMSNYALLDAKRKYARELNKLNKINEELGKIDSGELYEDWLCEYVLAKESVDSQQSADEC